MEKYNDAVNFYETIQPPVVQGAVWRFVKRDINPFNVSETVEYWMNFVTGEWDYRRPQPRVDDDTTDGESE